MLVDCFADGQPVGADEAADLLNKWARACPGLLGQVTHVTLDCWDTQPATEDGDPDDHLAATADNPMASPIFRDALISLLQRCCKLENLVISTSTARHTKQIADDLHLRFRGAPPTAPDPIRLDDWLAGATIPPSPSSSVPHTTPAAARMAQQLAAFRTHPDISDPASWPHYPCLAEVSVHPRAPPASLLPCSALCQSLQSLELCHLAAAPIPPIALLALCSLSQLAELRLAAYAIDGTPLVTLWDTIGHLPTIRSLHMLQGAHPDDILEAFVVPPSWSQLTSMTRLYITVGQPVQLQQLAPLTSLHRLYVQFAAGHLSHLSCLSQLTALKMDATGAAQLRWADASTGAVTWGAGLQELDVEGCLDTGADAVAAVARLAGIKVLRLCLAEGLPSSVLAPVTGLQALEELAIGNPPLEPQLWRILSQLPALKILQLQTPEDDDTFLARDGPPAPRAPDDRALLPALQHLSATFHSALAWALAWCSAPRIRSAFAERPPEDTSLQPLSRVWLQPSLVHPAWFPALLAGLDPTTRGPSDSPADAAPPLFVLATDADVDALLGVPPATLLQLGLRLQLAGDGALGLPALERLLQHVAADKEAAAQLQFLQVSIPELSAQLAGPSGFNGRAFGMAVDTFRGSLEALRLEGCQGLGSEWMLGRVLQAAPRLRDVFLQHAYALTDELLMQMASSQQLYRQGGFEQLQIAGGDEFCRGITLAGVLPLVASAVVKQLTLYKPNIFDLEHASNALRRLVHPGQKVVLLQPEQETSIGATCGAIIERAPDVDSATVALMAVGHGVHYI